MLRAVLPNADEASDDELSDDALTGRVRVLQRVRGHRYSVDDVATAWVAARAMPSARLCLDLGCGIGSVLLMVADSLPEAQCVGIEAQAQSFSLVTQNVARNQLGARVQAHHGDLRDAALLEALRREVTAGRGFDLITGTPPYKKAGTATPSPDSQRAHARMELRGGIEEYLSAAGRMLAEGGLCVVCAEASADGRVEDGARLAGLTRLEQLDVVPMAGRKGRLFAVHTLCRAADATRHGVGRDAQLASPSRTTFVARDAQGVRTTEERAMRAFFGLGGEVDDASPPLRRS
jgi:tRNA1Val (adenine37-N6)-methyltransferase